MRSFAEVFLHVSAANYNLYKLVGTPPPSGFEVKGFEKSTTDKAKVMATLKDSFAHARKAITAMPDANLDKSLDWFGGKNTERGILLFVVRHAAEHLGQSIAYARFIGVVPPWTEDMQKQQKQKGGGCAERQAVILVGKKVRNLYSWCRRLSDNRQHRTRHLLEGFRRRIYQLKMARVRNLLQLRRFACLLFLQDIIAAEFGRHRAIFTAVEGATAGHAEC